MVSEEEEEEMRLLNLGQTMEEVSMAKLFTGEQMVDLSKVPLSVRFLCAL